AAGGWRISGSFFHPISTIVSVLVVLTLVFDKWAWTWPVARWIWHRPDLRGTWKGEIQSNHEGAKPSIEAYLSIDETFSRLVVRMFTAESDSKTRVATIEAADDGVDEL